jgi:hypothetical protein
MSIIGFPLLLIPIAICNIVVFLMPGVGFDAALSRIPLPSGAVWTITAGDMLVALGALLLLLEVIKAGRPGARYVTDHLLSLLVFGGTVAEFVMLPQFGNATVFLLATLMLVDFVAGIALRSRKPARVAAKTEGKAAGKPAAAPVTRTDPKLDVPAAPAAPSAETPITPAAATASPTTTSSAASSSAQPYPAQASSASSSSASSSAASMAEAVLLDRPEPIATASAAASSPQVQSPGLQPVEDAANSPPRR